MKKNRFLIILLVIFFGINLSAQSGSSIHIGTALPLGNFSDFNLGEENAGYGAGTGFNFGGEYILPIGETGFGFLIGADINYNQMGRDFQDAFESENPETTEIDYSSYLNIPIAIGLNFSKEVGDHGIFLNLAPTFSLLQASDFTSVVQAEDGGIAISLPVTQSFDNSSAFGGKISGGFELNRSFALELSYFALGNHTRDSQVDFGGLGTEDLESIDQGLNLATITLGYIF